MKRWIVILAVLAAANWAGGTLSSDPEWRYLSVGGRGTLEVLGFDEADALFGRR